MKKEKKVQALIDDMRQERKESKDSLDTEKQKIFHERMDALLSQYGIIQNRTLTSFKTEIANKIYATDRTVSDYILGKKPCSPAALIAIADYFSTRTDKDGNINIISVDYLLGRTDHTSLGNEYIHDVTGLSDKAIDKLRRMNNVDRIFRHAASTLDDGNVWNSIFLALKVPVINAFICSRKFLDFLTAFKNYTWNDYFWNIGVKQDDNFCQIDGKIVLFTDDPDDNMPLDINTSFLKAVSKNQMDMAVDDISNACRKDNTIFSDWYTPLYYASQKKKADKKPKNK